MTSSSSSAAVSAAALCSAISYKPGWSFKVAGPRNRFLCIFVTAPDSLAPTRQRCTQHQFELPDIVDARGFYRWAFERVLLAEQHEAGEVFQVGDLRPFFPYHEDEGSPHELVERWEH